MMRCSRPMSWADCRTWPSGGRRSTIARPAASTSWYVRFERPPEMNRAVNGGVDARDVGGDPVGDPRQVDAGADVRVGHDAGLRQLVAQVALEHLAGRRARQRLGAEEHLRRHLEAGQLGGRELLQLRAVAVAPSRRLTTAATSSP